MRHAALLAIALGGACSAESAQAQRETETGSIIAKLRPAEIPDGLSQAARGRLTAVAFGECVVSRMPHAAERAAMATPGTPEEGRAFRAASPPECLRDGELRMPPAIMRGALYVALYRRDFGSRDHSLATSDRISAIAVANLAPLGAGAAARAFGDCVVQRDPADSRMVVMSPVGSLAEQAGYERMASTLAACIPADQQLRFSKAIMQGTIAESLYRRAGNQKTSVQ